MQGMFLFDARGLKCPLPVLKARRKLSQLQNGESLEILTTDPGAPADFKAFCQVTGNQLILEEINQDDLSAGLIIKKSNPNPF